MRNTMLNFRLALTSFLLLVFCYGAYSAWSFTARARYFPLAIAVAGVIVGLIAVIGTIVSPEKAIESGRKVQDIGGLDDEGPRPLAELQYLAWILGYALGVWVVGLVIASNLFLIAFLLRVARWPIWRVLVAAVLVTGALYAVTIALNLRWPVGLLGL